MTKRLLQFTFFMSLSFVFATAIQAQKFQNKGDLKPVIENIFIWHATHTEANIDRSGNSGMGVGTFNDNGVSGAENSNGSQTMEGNNTNTNNTSENDGVVEGDNEDVIQTDGNNDDNSTISINPSGLLTENNTPSRGGNNSNNNGDGNITSPNNDTDNDSHPLGGRQDNILEDILNYPNPASDEINVLVPLMDELVRIRLINLSGQPVIDQKAYSNSRVVLDTYHLPEGVYLLEFTGSGKQLFRRTYIKR